MLTAEWLAARCSDLELYQSGEDLAWARRLRIVGRSRSRHLGNGVDLERFTPARAGSEEARKLRAELGIGEDELVVGTVGRMVREKGFLELFRAARIVRERVPLARFLVLGEGDAAKPDAIAAAEVESAREDVLFTGWRDDVAELMSVMDVFTLPSWREGMPRSAIEAAASGLPLVLTDIRGCREVVRDGVEGLLVPVRDPEALADALTRVLGIPRSDRGWGPRPDGERRPSSTSDAWLRRWSVRPSVCCDGVGSAAPGSTVVRRARGADARAMGRLHASAMPTAFLPTLGEGFLTQLYRELATDPSAVALVAVRDGLVTGFAAGVRLG